MQTRCRKDRSSYWVDEAVNVHHPTIFFDLDGTLTDPEIGITRCIQFALEKLGEQPPPQQALTWCIGPPLQESFTKLVGGERAGSALKLYRERFSEIGLFENTLYPGIEPCLSGLADRGVRLCIASSKPRVYVERILHHFGLDQFFEHAFGSELDGTRTDKTDLLRFALQETRADAASSLMVGDRKHDITGATNNGMHAIGVLYGFGSREELVEAGATQLADSPADLASLIQAS